MGWLREFRSSLENPQTPLSYPAEWLLDIFNGGRTDAGIRVSQLTALQVSTVYACVDIVSSGVANAPLNVYERLEQDSTQIAYDENTYYLLHDEPNPEMTSFTFRKTLQAHALLWANLYAEIQRDASGRPVALWPRNPDKTKPKRLSGSYEYKGEILPPGTLVYVTTEGVTPEIQAQDGSGISKGERVIAMEDMVHIPGLSLDGRLGHDVIWLSRQVIGLALAAEKYGAKFFGNGARPGSVINVPQNMSAPAQENFRRSLQEAVGGENMHRPLILEGDMKWQQMQTANNDAQFLETRQFQRLEICSIFHVPPHMVGEVDKSSGRSNMEQMGQELVSYTFGPWFTAWEQELARKLFPKRGRTANKFFPGFDLEGIMLPDAESRGKYFAAGRQWGWFNTNDIRRKLRMNVISGPAGEKYWKPVNMMDADESLSPTMSSKSDSGAKVDDTEPTTESKGSQQETERYIAAYFRLFNERFHAYLGREKRDLEACRKVFLPVLSAIAAGIRMNAAPLLGVSADGEAGEVEHLLADYVSGMHKRSAEWKDDDEAVRGELTRAVRAIKIAVYRDLATQKAKGE